MVFTEVWMRASFSRTLLSILTNFSSAVVWTVLVLWKNFSSQVRFWYLFSFLITFTFTQWTAGTAKSISYRVLLFLFTKTSFDLLARIGLSVCISWNPWKLSAKFSWMLSKRFHDSFWFFYSSNFFQILVYYKSETFHSSKKTDPIRHSRIKNN